MDKHVYHVQFECWILQLLPCNNECSQSFGRAPFRLKRFSRSLGANFVLEKATKYTRNDIDS